MQNYHLAILFGLFGVLFIVAGCPSDDDDTVSDDDSVDDDDTTMSVDADGDGWDETTDCDDNDATVFPGAPELCDGLDNDCNGVLPTDESDADVDGFMECDDDCDDQEATVYPASSETLCADGLDNDCDGLSDCDDPNCTWNQTCPAISLASATAAFIGEDTRDNSGYSVSSAGDVDGDGFDDILIGAFGNGEGGYYAGKTYLMLGSMVHGGGVFELSAADIVFIGESAGDRSGYSVSSAGDVDGDGLDDVLIGAFGNDDGGNDAGKTYLMLGSTIYGGGVFELSAADIVFIGESAGDRSGYSVSSAGDVDGDGFDDVLIGAYGNGEGGYYAGKTYLMLGSTVQGGGTFALSAANIVFIGEAAYDYSGAAVSSAGDVDGDGFDDILIGAYGHDEGGLYAGKTYLMLGSTVQGGGTFALSAANIVFIGESAGDRSGYSVSSAGDVDGDGLDDVLIGAFGNDDGGSDAGKTYLMLGSTVYGGGVFELSVADAAFLGEQDFDQSGAAVSSAGDVDGDGLDDVLIGAHNNHGGSYYAGKTYLMLGSTVYGGGVFELSVADTSFAGEIIYEYSGAAVSSAGDVDGDGLDDVLIGAYGHDDGGDDAGKTYLFISPY